MSTREQRSTSERIIVESLNLFSERGFDGVSMRDIAAAVDIKAASIYSHFKGKEAIFDAILQMMQDRYEAETAQLQINGESPEEDVAIYEHISEQTLQGIGRSLFTYFVEDDFTVKCRKMLTMEQYRNPKLAKVYSKEYFDDPIEYQSTLFAMLMEKNVFRKSDPKVMAMHYYAPIYELILLCDREPERKAEALKLLESHIHQTNELYGAPNS